tara:strand:+ start:535 stop:2202 length:1668 start_codon:yes stop_codon:yes gene_type:complete
MSKNTHTNSFSYKKLLSIHLQSNNTENFQGFIDSIIENVDNASLIEVIVKIDDDDYKMNRLLKKISVNEALDIKYISTPLIGSFADLWRSMNDMLLISEESSYFIWNMNDEMRIKQKHWDKILMNYVKLFKDDIFRLRTSCFRNRNYTDPWECAFAPETSAITTKRWMEICGNWNPTLGPDSFNQIVSYYFSYHDRFNKFKEIRDVVINDFEFEGEGASLNLTKEQIRKRMGDTLKAWFHLLSHKTLTEASRRSQRLKAFIDFNQKFKTLNVNPIIIDKDEKLNVYNPFTNIKIFEYPYKVPLLNTVIKNFFRSFRYFEFGGGGYDFSAKKMKYRPFWSNYIFFILLKTKAYNAIKALENWETQDHREIKEIQNKITKVSGLFKIVHFYTYFVIPLIPYIKIFQRQSFNKKIYPLNIVICFFAIPFFIFEDLQIIRKNYLVLNNKNIFKKIVVSDSYDSLYFLNRLDYFKIYKNFSMSKNKILFFDFTIIIKIIMISKFYNFNLQKLERYKNIFEKLIPNSVKLIENFELHNENIKEIDKFLSNNYLYNLREFMR